MTVKVQNRSSVGTKFLVNSEFWFWGQHMDIDLQIHFASALTVHEANEMKYAHVFISVDHSFNM